MACAIAMTVSEARDVIYPMKMNANTDLAMSSLIVPIQWAASIAHVFRVTMEMDSLVMVSLHSLPFLLLSPFISDPFSVFFIFGQPFIPTSLPGSIAD